MSEDRMSTALTNRKSVRPSLDSHTMSCPDAWPLTNHVPAAVTTTVPLLARWLGLDNGAAPAPEYSLALESTDTIKTGLAEITIPSTSAAVGKQIVELGLPKEVVIMMIGRNKHGFIPTGRSTLHADDTLLVFADKNLLAETQKIIDAYTARQIPGARGEVV